MAIIQLDKRTGKYSVRFYWDGVQHQRTCDTKRRAEANRTLALIEDTIHLLRTGRLEMPEGADACDWIVAGGKLSPKRKKTEGKKLTRFGQIADAYLKDQRQKQATTIATEKIHIGHLKRILRSSTQINSITLDSLKAYRRRRSAQKHHGKRIGDGTIKKELSTFRQIWTWAKQHNYVETPCPLLGDGNRWNLTFAKPSSRDKFKTWDQIEREIKRGRLNDEQAKELWKGLFLDQDQVKELLADVKKRALHDFVYPLFTFCAYTGARRSELLRSQIEDFDFETKLVTIRERKRRKDRSGSTRVVPIHPKLEAVMEEWFDNHPGGPFTIESPMHVGRAEWTGLNRDQAHHHFQHTLRNCRWSVVPGFHTLRHSFGSNLIRSGTVSSDVVARWMGHSTMEMRELYQHLFPQDGVEQIRALG